MMMIRILACVAAAALAGGAAAPASAATFLGDQVVIKRVQGGNFVFKEVKTTAGVGFEFSDNFFSIDITDNQVIFDAIGGNFSLGDIKYEIAGLDFDDNPATPNVIEGFASTQILGSSLDPFGVGRATIRPDGVFSMSFSNTTGSANGLASITFGAPVPAGVPEPATWAMMISGFGLAGGAMRAARRKPRELAAG